MMGLRVAVSLLTRVPAGVREVPAGGFDRAVAWFPVVGALVGCGLAGLYAGLLVLLPPLVAATITVACGFVLTGALHEDGLADVADALGGRDREHALAIMKDPVHGTYGMLAIVTSVVVRLGALAALDAWSALAALASAHALSRTGVLGLMALGRPATAGGLGASYLGEAGRGRLVIGMLGGLAIGGGVTGTWVLVLAGLVAAGSALVGVLAIRRFGGLTGDVLGAAQQAGEVLVLLATAAVAVNGWAALASWVP